MPRVGLADRIRESLLADVIRVQRYRRPRTRYSATRQPSPAASSSQREGSGTVNRFVGLQLTTPPARPSLPLAHGRRVVRVQRIGSQHQDFFAVPDTVPVGIRVQGVSSEGRLL